MSQSHLKNVYETTRHLEFKLQHSEEMDQIKWWLPVDDLKIRQFGVKLADSNRICAICLHRN